MKIEVTTKFNIGDTVYFLEENHICQATINAVNFGCSIRDAGNIPAANVTYYLTGATQLSEDKCFISKQELCNDLMTKEFPF